jgi:predicted transcriptional regulator
MMPNNGRVVTVNLPNELFSRIGAVAARIDRTKSWIVREAVSQWVEEEERRYELTLEALQSVDEGHTISHEEVLAKIEQRKRERRDARGRS